MTSPTKFYHVTQIIFQMWSCEKSLVTLVFLREKLSQTQFFKDLTRKTTFFEGWSWFKFNKLGLALKVRKFLGLIPTFVELTAEKLVGERERLFSPTPLS